MKWTMDRGSFPFVLPQPRRFQDKASRRQARYLGIHHNLAHPPCQYFPGALTVVPKQCAANIVTLRRKGFMSYPIPPPSPPASSPPKIPTDRMQETPASGSPASCSIVIGGWQAMPTVNYDPANVGNSAGEKPEGPLITGSVIFFGISSGLAMKQ